MTPKSPKALVDHRCPGEGIVNSEQSKPLAAIQKDSASLQTCCWLFLFSHRKGDITEKLQTLVEHLGWMTEMQQLLDGSQSQVEVSNTDQSPALYLSSTHRLG